MAVTDIVTEALKLVNSLAGLVDNNTKKIDKVKEHIEEAWAAFTMVSDMLNELLEANHTLAKSVAYLMDKVAELENKPPCSCSG